MFIYDHMYVCDGKCDIVLYKSTSSFMLSVCPYHRILGYIVGFCERCFLNSDCVDYVVYEVFSSPNFIIFPFMLSYTMVIFWPCCCVVGDV